MYNLCINISDIYNAEFVLSAIMTQYIDYDMAYTKF